MNSLHVLVVAALAALAAVQGSGQQGGTPPATPPASGTQQATPPAGGAKPATPPAAGAQQATPPGEARTAAQAPAGDEAAAKFSNEQLEQIAAPIALHPDALLAHIFMASTYPLEIVEAQRWLEKNSKLKDKALEDALKQQDWDDSVKSLCTFPTVLKQMSDNLDWTQDLGDAVLGQKKELMEAVQRMRKKALDSGNLKTSEQQKVSSEGDVIIIQSSSPEVIYVPTYSPTVVYGGWSYPYYYYPPMYAPYPPGAGFVSFAFGVAVGGAIWGNCNWGHTDIDIDVNRNNEFNRNVNREPRSGDRAGDRASNRGSGGTSQFKHDPSHRGGVNYKSPDVANRMGASQGTNRVSRDQARGFDRGGASASTRPSTGAQRPSTGASQRPSTSPSTRPSSGGSTARPSTTPSRSSSSSSRSSAMSGSRSAGMERSASSRGASSRSSGASRGGGSRGGGGGRRR